MRTHTHTHIHTQGNHKHLETYLLRCVEQLQAKQGVFTALRTLRSLLELRAELDKDQVGVAFVCALL